MQRSYTLARSMQRRHAPGRSIQGRYAPGRLMAINLNQCAVLLGAAVLAVSIFRFLKLSSILGYVAAGMVIGPWGFRLVKDVPSVMSFSEFGIVLLLFIIGLGLQATRLWVMRR